jgi:hypothetical protein
MSAYVRTKGSVGFFLLALIYVLICYIYFPNSRFYVLYGGNFLFYFYDWSELTIALLTGKGRFRIAYVYLDFLNEVVMCKISPLLYLCAKWLLKPIRSLPFVIGTIWSSVYFPCDFFFVMYKIVIFFNMVIYVLSCCISCLLSYFALSCVFFLLWLLLHFRLVVCPIDTSFPSGDTLDVFRNAYVYLEFLNEWIIYLSWLMPNFLWAVFTSVLVASPISACRCMPVPDGAFRSTYVPINNLYLSFPLHTRWVHCSQLLH